MKISMIAASAKNGVIGNDNKLPWYLPEDLKYFKSKTIGKPIIMGRKTFESMGRPLPNRASIVLSRNKRLKLIGAEVVSSVDEALAVAVLAAEKLGVEETMIIGGEQLYRLMMDKADTIYLTEVDIVVEGDAFFPEFDKTIWQEVASESPKKSEEGLACCFKTYTK